MVQKKVKGFFWNIIVGICSLVVLQVGVDVLNAKDSLGNGTVVGLAVTLFSVAALVNVIYLVKHINRGDN